MDSIGGRNEEDRQSLEEKYQNEIAEFNQRWDEDLTTINKDFNEHIENLTAQHTEQLEEARRQFEERTPQVPKPSSEYLNLKKIEQQLVKQNEFAEAHQVQQKGK